MTTAVESSAVSSAIRLERGRVLAEGNLERAKERMAMDPASHAQYLNLMGLIGNDKPLHYFGLAMKAYKSVKEIHVASGCPEQH